MKKLLDKIRRKHRISPRRLAMRQREIARSIPLIMDGRQVNINEQIIGAYTKPLPPAQLDELKRNLKAQFNKIAKQLPFDGSELENESPLPLRTVLMASPEKLTDERSLAKKTDVFEDWFCIRHALVKAGAHVEIMPTTVKDGGFREVYTRDRYLIIGDKAYLPDPSFVKKRNLPGVYPPDLRLYRQEIKQAGKTLRNLGIDTVIVKDAWFEGGNAVRHYSSRTLFLGLDGDTTKTGAQLLAAAVNATQPEKWSVLPVPLTNMPDMYHLDTGMSEELPHGEVMISPRVTDSATFEKIRAIVGAENIIPLSDREAGKLATNMIDIGHTLVMTGNCPTLRTVLEKRGYTVVMPHDYSRRNFEFGMGGVHCMTNDVRQRQPCSHVIIPSI